MYAKYVQKSVNAQWEGVSTTHRRNRTKFTKFTKSKFTKPKFIEPKFTTEKDKAEEEERKCSETMQL